MIWYACENHLEYVLDDFIEQTLEAPDIEKVTNETQEKPGCHWPQCTEKGLYRLQTLQKQEEGH